MEDQDRKTPEEEKEVEAHAHDFEAPADFEKQGDDVEAHALRDFEEFTDFERSGEGEKKDFE